MPKRLFFIFMMLIVFQSCYFSKTIEGPCTMRIEFKNSLILKRPDYPKYIDYSTDIQYHESFYQGLKEELTSMGVVITDEPQSEFVLLITSITLEESVSISTVDDASSPYHGQSYALHSCDADAEYTLYRNGKKVSSGWAGVSKEEKLSNNRNFGDYLFGTNKDNTEYRYKGLDSEICMDLAKRCGKRTASRITKKVSRAMK